ncbi:MAG: hypothetical protein KAX80_06950, partial [Planctomycetes bacterium]|nr:hypothetical protein [Planctomycetota bacterium]
TRDLLLKLNLLTDIDLAWRWRLIDVPWDKTFRYYDSMGRRVHGPLARVVGPGMVYGHRLNTTLDELLSRETTYLAVVAGDGQLLFRFPAGSPGFEPPVKVLVTELEHVLEPYRSLAEGRHHLEQGRVEAAVSTFRRLAQGGEAVSTEVRKAAEEELESLLVEANEGLQQVEKALARKDFEGAWRSLAELQGQGLHQVNQRLEGKVADLRQRLEDHATASYQKAQERLEQERFAEASYLLRRVARFFEGSEAGSLARKKLDELAKDPEMAERVRQARRQAEAERLWTTATAAEQVGDLLRAYQTYKNLSDNYSDLPEGTQAKEKVSAWEADAEFMANITALQAQGEAAKLMALGNNLFVNKVYTKAIQYYRKVIDTCPDGPLAQEAHTRLEDARRLLEAQLKKKAGEEPGTGDQEKSAEPGEPSGEGTP